MNVLVLLRIIDITPMGTSKSFSMIRDYPIAPQIGDEIEIVPERGGPGQSRHISAWHQAVDGRWIHTTENDPKIEIHVSVRGPLEIESINDLIKEGWSRI